MSDYDMAIALITRLELIQMKDIPLTPEKMLEKFGAKEVRIFYEKICKEN